MSKTFALLFGVSTVWLIWKLHQKGFISIPIAPQPRIVVAKQTSLLLPLILISLAIYMITETETIIRKCQQCLSGISIDCCFKAGLNNISTNDNNYTMEQTDKMVNFNDLNDDIITFDYHDDIPTLSQNKNKPNMCLDTTTTTSTKEEYDEEYDEADDKTVTLDCNSFDDTDNAPKIKINKMNKIIDEPEIDEQEIDEQKNDKQDKQDTDKQENDKIEDKQELVKVVNKIDDKKREKLGWRMSKKK
jgi:hypothetical protein